MKCMRHPFLALILLTLLFGATTVFAKKNKPPPPPAVTVVSRWTPQEQLVSLPTDTRTVNLQMSARADRQIWAMDISCAVNLTGVFKPESANQSMTWGASWLNGNDATNYFDSTRDSDSGDAGIQYYDSITNRINAAITRVGASNSPVGLNGTTYTEFLFNLELTLAEGLTGTNTVSLTCDKLSFLDRNGVSLGTATLSSTNNLTVREGYVISGKTIRQGSTDKSSVEVSCENLASGNVYTLVTQTNQVLDSKGNLIEDLSGQFSFSNAFGSSDPLREFGLYECTFTSKFDGSEDTVYLQGTSFINLQTPDYSLQPITLRTGDTNGDNNITIVGDLPLITASPNWEQTVAPFTTGDVNGDGAINTTDLAITASNVGLSDSPSGVLMDHVLYSVARDFNGTFPNNSLVMGDVFSGDVNTLNTNRSFWPQVSPDGSQVAYYAQSSYQVDKKGRVTTDPKKAVQTIIEEGLFIGDTTSFSGSLVASGKNFAPAWSPSGGKIAYVCSWAGFQNGIEGYYYNNGNICVVDASGGTVQTIIPSGALSTYAEIFPPAWYDETTLVYAGNTNNAICPDQLCYYDMLTNTHGKLTINGVDGSSTFANMPIIIRYSDGLSYLFYRYFTSSSSELRMGTVAYDSGTDSWTASGVQSNTINTNLLHEQVDNSSGVHYYDVSPMLDVMFYEFGDYQFQNRFFDTPGASFSWSSGSDHIVDGFIGYPTVDEFNNVWDGFDELSAGTDFHAFRATFDWLP